jgi:hypothetical protein
MPTKPLLATAELPMVLCAHPSWDFGKTQTKNRRRRLARLPPSSYVEQNHPLRGPSSLVRPKPRAVAGANRPARGSVCAEGNRGTRRRRRQVRFAVSRKEFFRPGRRPILEPGKPRGATVTMRPCGASPPGGLGIRCSPPAARETPGRTALRLNSTWRFGKLLDSIHPVSG